MWDLQQDEYRALGLDTISITFLMLNRICEVRNRIPSFTGSTIAPAPTYLLSK